MQMEMTERDKKLLVFLALFVIIVGFGYWGIRPLLGRIGEVKSDIEVQSQIKTINELKASSLPICEKDNEELEADIISARQTFYPMMQGDAIDKMLTGMVLDYDLYSYQLSIRLPEEEVISKPYKYSSISEGEERNVRVYEDFVKSYDIEQIDDYVSGDDTEAEESPSIGIYKASVTMELGGEPEKLQQLIDDISASGDKMVLTGYDWTKMSVLKVDDEGQYKYENSRGLLIYLDIYMCAE